MVIRISMRRFKSSGEILVLSGPDGQGSNRSVRGIGSEPRLGTEEIVATNEVRFAFVQVGLLGSGMWVSFQAMCTG